MGCCQVSEAKGSWIGDAMLILQLSLPTTQTLMEHLGCLPTASHHHQGPAPIWCTHGTVIDLAAALLVSTSMLLAKFFSKI